MYHRIGGVALTASTIGGAGAGWKIATLVFALFTVALGVRAVRSMLKNGRPRHAR